MLLRNVIKTKYLSNFWLSYTGKFYSYIPREAFYINYCFIPQKLGTCMLWHLRGTNPMQTLITHSFIWWDHGLDKLRGGDGRWANGVCSSKEKLASRTSFICWRIMIVKSKKWQMKINYTKIQFTTSPQNSWRPKLMHSLGVLVC